MVSIKPTNYSRPRRRQGYCRSWFAFRFSKYLSATCSSSTPSKTKGINLTLAYHRNTRGKGVYYIPIIIQDAGFRVLERFQFKAL